MEEKKTIKDKLIAILTALIIYAGALFIGVGVFSLMDHNLVFASFGFVQIFLYLGIAVLAALVTVSALSLSFRNISLLKMFPSLVGPLSYIGLFFYFRIYNAMTIVPTIIMCLYSLYIFLRGTIALEEVSYLDNKVEYLRDKHPNSYVAIYLSLGILVPSILTYFSFVPSLYYLQTSFMLLAESSGYPLAFYDVIAWVMMGGGMLFSIAVDIPLFIHKLKKGNDVLYEGGLRKKMAHPDMIGEIVFYLGASLFIFHFSNMYAFILFPIALFIYVLLLIHPLCLKADSSFIKGYKEKWRRK